MYDIDRSDYVLVRIFSILAHSFVVVTKVEAIFCPQAFCKCERFQLPLGSELALSLAWREAYGRNPYLRRRFLTLYLIKKSQERFFGGVKEIGNDLRKLIKSLLMVLPSAALGYFWPKCGCHHPCIIVSSSIPSHPAVRLMSIHEPPLYHMHQKYMGGHARWTDRRCRTPIWRSSCISLRFKKKNWIKCVSLRWSDRP